MMMTALAISILLAQQAPEARFPPTVPDTEGQWKQLVDLAIRTGIREEVAPLPLGSDGSRRHGIAIDPFRFIANAARMIAAGGEAATPQRLGQLRRGQFMVVAYPLECNGQLRSPRKIEIWGPAQQPVARNGDFAAAADLRRMLPWLSMPEGAIGGMFLGPTLPAGGEVVLTYDGLACPADSPTISLPVKAGPPVKIVDVPPTWPMGAMGTPANSPAEVQVQATIDLEGVPTNIKVLSAPSEFNLAAASAVRQWRYKPFTINGAPAYAPITMSVKVTFTRR